MYPFAHDDGRGARFHADDRAGIAFLYGTGGGDGGGGDGGDGGGDGGDGGGDDDPPPPPPPTSKPARPTHLTGAAASTTSVRLAWVDHADNEETVRIEARQGAGKPFVEIATVGPDTTEVVVSGLLRGKPYVFRVRAANAKGFSLYSNKARVKLPRR
jgi:hypothetical protein